MANLRVFVSSTCYDLSGIRSQIRNFLTDVGYEPIMSDYSDVLYDPRHHTHTSCVMEVANSDLIVVVIGSRFGGTAIPKATEIVDLEKVRQHTNAKNPIADKISITQLEVLRGIEKGVPIFAFVDKGVYHDHLTYEKNKENRAILPEIKFPHIEKQETAPYIFEFMNFVRLRTFNNDLTPFEKFEDIENHLRKQWSGLFQRLLSEQRNKVSEEQQIDFIASQISDIKAALMTSISETGLKETARGAIRFRHVIELVVELGRDISSLSPLLSTKITLEDLMTTIGIQRLEPFNRRGRERTAFVKNDGTFYLSRIAPEVLHRTIHNWHEFYEIQEDATRRAIVNAVIESSEGRNYPVVTYYPEQFDEVKNEEGVISRDSSTQIIITGTSSG